MGFEYTAPDKIEARSFEIIANTLARMGKAVDGRHAFIVKRCIHASADFDYADNLYFGDGAVDAMLAALLSGCGIVTDTEMARAGINKAAVNRLGVSVNCFISDEDVAAEAKERGTTRAAVGAEKAAGLDKPLIFAVGNAPTALIKLHELMARGYKPAGIIAVPIGFVNVAESKELIISSGAPCVAARGQKGGSPIAAAICNALVYEILKGRG